MGTVEFDLSVSALFDYARAALDGGDYLLCIQNLNEAADKCVTSMDRKRLYGLYAEAYHGAYNDDAERVAVLKNALNSDSGDYFRFCLSDLTDARDDDCLYDDEEEEEGFKNSDSLLTVNAVINYLNDRSYAAAFETIMTNMFNVKDTDRIVDAVLDSLNCDPKLKVSDYLVPFVSLLARAQDRPDLISAFVSDGELSRQVIIDSAEVIIDSVDDAEKLVDIGEILFIADELDIAKRYFEEALKIEPYNEAALYYMAYVTNITDNYDKAKPYLFKAKELYSFTGFPFGSYNDFLLSGDKVNLTTYPFLPSTFTDKETEEIISDIQSGISVAGLHDRIIRTVMVADDDRGIKLIQAAALKMPLEESSELLKKLLIEPRVALIAKKAALSMLVALGYEGGVSMIDEDEALAFRLTALHHRAGERASRVYRDVLSALPFFGCYMPIKCTLLGNLVKKLDESIKIEDDTDEGMAGMLVLYNYVKRLKINVNAIRLFAAVGIDEGLLAKWAEKKGGDILL